MKKQRDSVPFVLRVGVPNLPDPLDQEPRIGEGIRVVLERSVLRMEGHRESTSLARVGQGLALKPRLFNDERRDRYFAHADELPGCIYLMGNGNEQVSSSTEDTPRFGNSKFHGVDILQAHERDNAIGYGIGDGQSSSITNEGRPT